MCTVIITADRTRMVPQVEILYDSSLILLHCSIRELGYLPIEINASDTRNKADNKITGGMGGKLANAVKEMCTNTAIGRDEKGQKKRVSCSPKAPCAVGQTG